MTIGRTALTAVSFHAPFVAGDASERTWRTARKEGAYQHLIDGIGSLDGPVVVGMDANAWTDPVDLHPLDPSVEQPITNSFHLADPPHRLLDAYRVWLDHHGEIKDRLRRSYPDGPLATTHNRGNSNYPKACRMDRIYAGPVHAVHDVSHHYGEAIAAGSDHAVVLAELEMP